jgi:small GTP-binding protein
MWSAAAAGGGGAPAAAAPAPLARPAAGGSAISTLANIKAEMMRNREMQAQRRARDEKAKQEQWQKRQTARGAYARAEGDGAPAPTPAAAAAASAAPPAALAPASPPPPPARALPSAQAVWHNEQRAASFARRGGGGGDGFGGGGARSDSEGGAEPQLQARESHSRVRYRRGAASIGGVALGTSKFLMARPVINRAVRAKAALRNAPVVVVEGMTVKELADGLAMKSRELLRRLLEAGERHASAREVVDPDVAQLLAEDLGRTVVRKEAPLRDRLRTRPPPEGALAAEGAPLRAPVVTVMGHVDHGKTSLLDALRGAAVAAREAGGITQGIAAFSVALRAEAVGVGAVRAPGGKGAKAAAAAAAAPPAPAAGGDGGGSGGGGGGGGALPSSTDVMTFIDTPGHALFSSLRAQGSSVTDIVVLVVDGKDGAMPQTKECVALITAASIPCVVAVTKCDTVEPAGAVARVAEQLLGLGLVTEPYGGEVPLVPLSARTGAGLAELKEVLALQAEMLDLRARTRAEGEAVVLDSRVVPGQGQVVDAVVTWGTLRVGDVVVAGGESGRVKAIFTDAVAAASLAGRLSGGGAAAEGAAPPPPTKGGSSKREKKEKGRGALAGEGAAAAAPAAAHSQEFSLSSVREALPGTPVRVVGLKGVPAAGTDLLVVADEERAAAVLEGRARRAAEAEEARVARASGVLRRAERAEYQKKRDMLVAFQLASSRERQRGVIERSGGQVPPRLRKLPWEVVVLEEARNGSISGISVTGRRVRPQGGQVHEAVMSYASAEAGGKATAPAAPLLLRADSVAALEALKAAVATIQKQAGGRVMPRVVAASVGDITERDVEYAAEMKAQVVAFGARASGAVTRAAERAKIKLLQGRVIYHVLDELCDVLGAMLPAERAEEVVAGAEVKGVFAVSSKKAAGEGAGSVAGLLITEGTLTKGASLYRVLRGEEVVHEAPALATLRHLQNNVDAAKKGTECGITVDGWGGWKLGDKLLAVKVKAVTKRLEVRWD